MGSPVLYLFVYILDLCALFWEFIVGSSGLSAMKSHLKEIDQWFSEHKLPNPITVVFWVGGQDVLFF